MLTTKDVEALRVRLMLVETLTALAVTGAFVPPGKRLTRAEAEEVRTRAGTDVRAWFEKIASAEKDYDPALLEQQSLRLLRGIERSIDEAAASASQRS